MGLYKKSPNTLDRLLDAQSKNTTQIWVYESGAKKPITEAEFEKKFGIKHLRYFRLDPGLPYEFFDYMVYEMQDDAVLEREYRKDVPDEAAMKKRISKILDKGDFLELTPTELRYLYKDQLVDGKTARVYVGRASEILGDKKFDILEYGLFAGTDIAKGQFIGEDTGNIELSGSDGHYSWFYDETPNFKYHINAFKMGNQMRFFNHSKNDNVVTVRLFIDDIFRVFTIAKRDIKKGEQLLLDYGDGYWNALGIEPAKL